MEDEIQHNDQKRQCKIGVVLGSGGIKALSSIPLFEFLEQEGIKPDLLVGCSGGGVLSSAWAMLQDASRVRKLAGELWRRDIFQKVDYRTLLAIAGLPCGRFDKSHGLVKAENLHLTLIKLFGDQQIQDLSTRLILQSTDLLTGAPVLLTSGTLWDAVYASSAMFPILPPICREGRWLIDGVYSSPVPILEAVHNDMDVIIAMSYEVREAEETNNFIAHFMHCIAYQSTWLTRSQLALSVDLHHHEIIFINVVFDKHLGFKSVENIPAIIEIGQQAVDAKKEEILAAINNYKA
ncbi:MAG: patatin-like phospholipase family protein [Calditrichaeota bacterium]|nr:MAG: patatin-like phospholipase family protein [Calditrichota bacterium]